MKYERLTKKFENGYVMADCSTCPSCNKCDDRTHYCQTTIKERLAELEDKIEQGTLIELPYMTYIKSAMIWDIIYWENGDLRHYRTTIKKYAVSKLKKLKGEV